MMGGLKRVNHFRILNKIGFLLCLLLIFGAAAEVKAGVPLMPLEEVRVGAHGVGRTVIAGTRIEEFGVEILGIMKNKGAVGDLILVRTYGDVIERSGGVAQGMSGSPVYLDGRLIGAIGYGWTLTDQKIAMVTPIQDMVKLLDRIPVKEPEKEPQKEPQKEPATAPAPQGKDAPPLQDKPAVDEKPPSNGKKPALPKEQLVMPQAQLATPLMAAGFGEHALAYLQAKLKPLKLTPYAVGDPPEGIAYGELEPGSAVGVQLVRGDVSLGALGTVTYVDGDKVLAFGHPFLKRGQSGFLMTNAYVFTTIKGLESSFKVGATGEIIGMISQDRGAGIAGEMNRYPNTVPMRMTVRTPELAEPKELAVQMVQDEEIVPILATASLMNAVDRAIDRAGSGTARISFEIAARGMPGETYKRENMFYSPESVTEAALAEFYEFMAFLASNPHNPVTIMDIRTEVEVSPERRTARILSAQPVQLSAKPGEAVDIEVKLKPHRAEPVTRTVSFTVPKEQAPGMMSLNVRGGGYYSMASLLKKLGLEGEIPKPSRKPPKSFEEMMKEYSSRDRNHDIVVELPDGLDFLEEGTGDEKKPKLKLGDSEKSSRSVRTARSSAEKDPAKPERTGKAKAALQLSATKQDRKNKGLLSTEYIIEGDSDISIEIIRDAKEGNP